MPGPLSGLKVLDLSRFIAGPVCAMQLADFGADVVKVEKKGAGEETRENKPLLNGESLYYISFNRNKRGIELDFRSKEDQETLRRLAAQADVLVENFRPGTMEKMGCSYEELKKLNPRLIMVRISGFGQTGPLSQRPCFDAIAQAMSGLMSITGSPDSPPMLCGSYIVDFLTSLYATIGIMVALRVREETGRGQLVEATLLESAISVLMSAIPQQAKLGSTMGRTGNSDRYNAPVDCYRTGDNEYVYISSGNDGLFARMIAVMGRPELADDPRFRTIQSRMDHSREVTAVVAEWVAGKTVEEEVVATDAAGIPCAKVASIKDVVENVQLRARNQIARVQHPKAGSYSTHGVVVTLSETPGAIERSAPLLGQHTDEVMREWLGVAVNA